MELNTKKLFRNSNLPFWVRSQEDKIMKNTSIFFENSTIFKENKDTDHFKEFYKKFVKDQFKLLYVIYKLKFDNQKELKVLFETFDSNKEKFKENWADHEGGDYPSSFIIKSSKRFLGDYFLCLLESGVRIVLPEMTPAHDGTLDFSWTHGSLRLLINTKSSIKGELLGSYYGYNQDNLKQFVKGNFSDKAFDFQLFEWLKNFEFNKEQDGNLE